MQYHAGLTVGQQTHPIQSICRVEGCCNSATRSKRTLCEKHYYRIRRHGCADDPASKLSISSHGYELVYAPTHPLANAHGVVYKHRMVVYDRMKDIRQIHCYHCQSAIDWHNLHIDHLDNNKKNNDIHNLVCSCPKCNQARGVDKMRDTMNERHGRMLTNGNRTMSVSQWARETGIGRTTINNRIDYMGMTVEQALTIPVAKTGPKKVKK